ncbi:uncharacterized protein HD556DRAFT_1360117, partial [Suillus plorans]
VAPYLWLLIFLNLLSLSLFLKIDLVLVLCLHFVLFAFTSHSDVLHISSTYLLPPIPSLLTCLFRFLIVKGRLHTRSFAIMHDNARSFLYHHRLFVIAFPIASVPVKIT